MRWLSGSLIVGMLLVMACTSSTASPGRQSPTLSLEATPLATSASQTALAPLIATVARGQVLIEEEIRRDARFFLANPGIREAICPAIRGLTALEAGELTLRLASSDGVSDEVRETFGTIYLEECERIIGD